MASSDRLQWGWKTVKVTEPEAEPAAAPERAEPRGPNGTFIGSGALFEGSLKLRGDFRIDSEFRGALVTDGKIVVGPSGSVEGAISGREVVIYGAVVGDVSARRQLILHAGCRLHGAIETACLEVEKHAFFRGTTVMTEPQVGRGTDAKAPETDLGPSGFAGGSAI